MNLTGNTVLITGGGSGIGLALAKQFLKYNNKVIICGRNKEKLANVKEKFPLLETIPCDVSDENSVSSLIEEVQKNYPDLNFLINNAGFMRMWNIQKKSANIKEQKEEIMINTFGPVQLTQLLIPHLARQKESAILNVSSGLAYVPVPAMPVYCAAKAALHSYTLSIREQLQNTNIKVFEVLPAFTDTEMVADIEMSSMSKMHPDKLAAYVLAAIQKNTYEIRPGIVKILYTLHRIFPSFAKSMMGKESQKMLLKI